MVLTYATAPVNQNIQLLRQQFWRIERIRKKPMRVEAYLQKWVPLLHGIDVNEGRWQSACIRELSRISGATEDNIRSNWGRNFDKAPRSLGLLLRREDIINQTLVKFQLPAHFPEE